MNPAKFWQTLNPGVPLPELPENPIEAVKVLFEACKNGDYFSLGFHQEPDAWPRIALGVALDYWQGQLAMQLTGLVNVGGNDSGDAWYLDTQADAGGEHRIYWYYHDTLDPEPVCRGIDSFLEYLALLRTSETTDMSGEQFLAESYKIPGVYNEERLEDWDASGDDGWESFAAIYDHEFQNVFVNYARKDWPESVYEPAAPTSVAKRTWMAQLMDCFAAHKQVVLPPDLNLEGLPPPQQRLVGEVQTLTKAIQADAIPDLVSKFLNDSDPILAKAAQVWVAEFEATRRNK